MHITLSVILVLVFLFSGGQVLAAWQTQGDTVNKITMSSVKGKIEETYIQGQEIYPNQEVEKRVWVANTGTVDMLVRVKVTLAWGDTLDEAGNVIVNPDLGTDNIIIEYDTEHWLYDEKDGYYYYKGVLKPGEKTPPLFESFTLDAAADRDYANKYGSILVEMECVQAGGDGISYWQKEYKDLGITYTGGKTIAMLTTVDFDSPEDGFSFRVNQGDLFANFKDLVPGESRSQEIAISNRWNEPVVIYFWAEEIEQDQATPETAALIEKLLKEYATIVITDESGKVIYTGPVWGNPVLDSKGTDSMKYPYDLGQFAAGQTKKLHVSLQLDPQMDNQYRDLLGKIKWVFRASDASATEIPPATTRPGTNDPTPSSPGTNWVNDGKTDLPQTGVHNDIWGYAGLMVLSVIGLVVILTIALKKRKVNDAD